MPDFAIRNLSVLAYAQGFTHWHYRHSGVLADVLAPGFFTPCAHNLHDRDVILVSAADEGAQLYVDQAGNKGVKVRVMSQTVPPLVTVSARPRSTRRRRGGQPTSSSA